MAEEQVQTVRRARAAPRSSEEESMSASSTGGGSPRKRSSKKKKIIFAVIVLVVLAVAGVAVYSSYELYKVKNPEYQQKLLQEQTQKIINKVGNLIELPAGDPQIATVSDVDTLKKTQAFFEKAQNGDQVLVFTDEAILYRPSTNKIINVAPVNRDESKTPTPPAEQKTTTDNSTKSTNTSTTTTGTTTSKDTTTKKN